MSSRGRRKPSTGKNSSSRVFFSKPVPSNDRTLSTTHDVGFFVPSTGNRETQAVSNLRKRQRVQLNTILEPQADNDTFAEHNPQSQNYAHLHDTDALLDDDEEEEDVQAGSKRKKKRYKSSDCPMLVWRPYAEEYLREILRGESLGSEGKCPSCGEDSNGILVRCSSGCPLTPECQSCALQRHSNLPLHVTKTWNGRFWDKASLFSLGLVYQLGHRGQACILPASIRKLTIIDVSGIHTVNVKFCGCSNSTAVENRVQLLRNEWYPATTVSPQTCATFNCLRSFTLFSVLGNINAHDFIRALERMSDALGVELVPDRYKSFGFMARQWGFLSRLKHAGRGHDLRGVEGTLAGECASLCWACPHDGINIPSDWRSVEPKLRFLYMLIIAVDANFRLKNRMRRNERSDPSLGPGWSYMLSQEPYKDHLRNYVSEVDASSCIVFAALMQKDTKLTTGLRCSGVGGCVCARHESVRPQGMGDLQKGERYANMDYIFFSSIIGISLLWITVTYDISCQWKKNLWSRMKALPERLHVNQSQTHFQFGLPVWHAAAHQISCQRENLLSYQPGVGRTDGEGIERTWSELNPAAYSTKEMGPGACADTLDHRIGNHNWQKNTGLGESLARKLVIAVEERDRQIVLCNEVNDTVAPAKLAEWKMMAKDWTEDRSKPNPYIVDGGATITEAQVRTQLRESEAKDTEDGKQPIHGTSMLSFMIGGLQLEDLQRRIISSLSSQLSARQKNVLKERRTSVLSKLKVFRSLQLIYEPGAARAITEFEDDRDCDDNPPEPERIKLWLPSELSASEQTTGCVPGLLATEAKLREAQCHDALNEIRTLLHARSHLITFRNDNVVGQHAVTRSRGLISRVTDKLADQAVKYRGARSAILSNPSVDATTYTSLKVLKDKDISLSVEIENDSVARQKLSHVGSRGPRRKADGGIAGELSWIWTTGLDKVVTPLSILSGVRVEWAKARARRLRWSEEVDLLLEEMIRTLRFLEWRSAWWLERAEPFSDLARDVTAGTTAYAFRQAWIHVKIAKAFRSRWEAFFEEGAIDRLVPKSITLDSILKFDAVRGGQAGSADDIETAADEETEGLSQTLRKTRLD